MAKLAICSDSHDNMANVKTFVDYCNKNNIKTILHCGDITTKETKQFFIENLKGKISFVDGNADINKTAVKKTNRFQKLKRQPVPFSEFEIENIKIAACHKKDKAIRLANSNKYNIVFYGHSHKPWKEKINSTYLINPGNIAGIYYRGSFAIYDPQIKKLDLIIIDQI